jgi:cell division protein FtsL
MRLKTAVVIAFALVLGGLLFLSSWQGFRYESLKREVRRMEEEQADWLELNKKLVAALAVLGSPARIERIATRDLGLKKIEPSRVTTVVTPGESAGE